MNRPPAPHVDHDPFNNDFLNKLSNLRVSDVLARFRKLASARILLTDERWFRFEDSIPDLDLDTKELIAVFVLLNAVKRERLAEWSQGRPFSQLNKHLHQPWTVFDRHGTRLLQALLERLENASSSSRTTSTARGESSAQRALFHQQVAPAALSPKEALQLAQALPSLLDSSCCPPERSQVDSHKIGRHLAEYFSQRNHEFRSLSEFSQFVGDLGKLSVDFDSPDYFRWYWQGEASRVLHSSSSSNKSAAVQPPQPPNEPSTTPARWGLKYHARDICGVLEFLRRSARLDFADVELETAIRTSAARVTENEHAPVSDVIAVLRILTTLHQGSCDWLLQTGLLPMFNNAVLQKAGGGWEEVDRSSSSSPPGSTQTSLRVTDLWNLCEAYCTLLAGGARELPAGCTDTLDQVMRAMNFERSFRGERGAGGDDEEEDGGPFTKPETIPLLTLIPRCLA